MGLTPQTDDGSRAILFQLTVTANGALNIRFPLGCDELQMRGWLDKVTEAARDWIREQARSQVVHPGTATLPPFPRG